MKQVQAVTANRPERALVVLHNNGAFSNFGIQSRYGFIFNAFGVKPASGVVDTSLRAATYFGVNSSKSGSRYSLYRGPNCCDGTSLKH